MVICVDKDYKCHVSGDSTMTEIETDAFDGKCAEYIEGFRYVPEVKTGTRLDGVVFTGVMVAPWKPYSELDDAQREYERRQYEAARVAYAALEDGLNSI